MKMIEILYNRGFIFIVKKKKFHLFTCEDENGRSGRGFHELSVNMKEPKVAFMQQSIILDLYEKL